MGGPGVGMGPMGGSALPNGVPIVGSVANLQAWRTISTDPTTGSGLAAGVGTIAVNGSKVWIKFGTGDTDWWEVQNVNDEMIQPYARRFAQQRAHARLGSADLITYWQDFEEGLPPGWEVTKPLGGVTGVNPGFGGVPAIGGVLSCFTAATAGQTAKMVAGNANAGYVPHISVSPDWFIRARMVIELGHTDLQSDAAWRCGIGFFDAAGVMQFFLGRTGAHGALPGAFHADGSITLTAATGTSGGAWFELEAWNTPDGSGLSIIESDGTTTTTTSVPNLYPNAGGTLGLVGINGAVAAKTGVALDWILIAQKHSTARYSGDWE